MANYYSPTVVQPSVPTSDMTNLEKYFLEAIFECKDVTEDGIDSIYFYSSEGVAQSIDFDELVDTIEHLIESDKRPSRLADTLHDFIVNNEDASEFEVDDSVIEHVFQDIVRRSKTVKAIIWTTSYTCDKMRPDGFGGSAVAITKNAIESAGTNRFISEFQTRHGVKNLIEPVADDAPSP